ncbi:MAG: mechanosensitive ion channel [Lachnospiraceae bacterium]|nr:mechanosensitive ion channel [Lachnospiraceae bacterium]
MENVFSTAVESTAEQIEQIEPIQPSDLSLTNLKKILEGLLPDFRSLAFNIIVCIVICLVGRQVIRLMRKMLGRALRRRNADAGLTRFLDSVLDLGMKAFLIFMILGQLGVNTASIITVFGTALIAIGMSLQGSLANVAGGILILLNHPFRVGHYIVCDYGEGTVSVIGLVYTTITTKDNRVLTIPNSQISNCAVTDCGENPVRRLDLITGISYDSDILKAKKVLQEVCDHCEYVLRDREVSIFVDSLGDSSVNMGVYCYVSSDKFLQAKWEITEQVKLRFDEAGIEIPFPHVQVQLKNSQ